MELFPQKKKYLLSTWIFAEASGYCKVIYPIGYVKKYPIAGIINGIKFHNQIERKILTPP
jgi:hypothetical protein